MLESEIVSILQGEKKLLRKNSIKIMRINCDQIIRGLGEVEVVGVEVGVEVEIGIEIEVGIEIGVEVEVGIETETEAEAEAETETETHTDADTEVKVNNALEKSKTRNKE